MKRFILFIALAAGHSTFALAESGFTFCRITDSNATAGQTAIFEHCIELQGPILEDGSGVLVDNGPTKGGDEAQEVSYTIQNGHIFVENKSGRKLVYKLTAIDNWFHITKINESDSAAAGNNFALKVEDAQGPCMLDPESC